VATRSSALFPYATLFRAHARALHPGVAVEAEADAVAVGGGADQQLVRVVLDEGRLRRARMPLHLRAIDVYRQRQAQWHTGPPKPDRKSTRLNSSHSQISY